MYCIQCGVKLADTENRCPLCGTVPFHPDIPRPSAERLYPGGRYPSPQVSPWGALVLATAAFLLPLLITFLCDWRLNHKVTWSGYVMGALVLSYVVVVLPLWFRHPNPVIFVPCSFGAVAVYLLYINMATGGQWFLTFAFPVVGVIGLLVTAVVTLVRYVRRGRLYVFGGAITALGLFMPLMEWLINITFHRIRFAAWSLYPLTALVLLGGCLLFLAICRPARESMERRFFI